ncbi:hypothetical protein FQA39_LY12991 [Lamprigera yunnana]|nr:hypothetical protein FQA39_LY12991 [Lamprigera yunnana]
MSAEAPVKDAEFKVGDQQMGFNLEGAKDELTPDGKIHDDYRIEYLKQHIEQIPLILNEEVIMENILGILARLNQEYEDSTNKHIAKVVLDNYSQGFSGYRQFNEYLKIEYHKYYAPVDKSESIEINTEEMLEKYTLFFQDIKDNALFFSNLISKLKKTKKLLILSSYQSHNVSQFIANLLNGKGYECKVYNPSENSISAADCYLEKES